MYSLNCLKKIGIIIIILLGILLYTVDPEYSAFIPKCPFHWITGLDCPACGSQRAIHQILHLNFRAAFWYNPFLIVSIPYITLLIVIQWFDPQNRLVHLNKISHHPGVVYTYLILILVWWVVRNIIPISCT